jgi:rare lipoprotein A (peptidoglycan hydrolase)
VEDLRTTRAEGRLAVVVLAAATMLVAPLALLHGGAAPAATAHAADGGRPATTVTGAATLGATQLVSSDAPDRLTAAELAAHRSAVRHNDQLVAAAHRRAAWRASAADRAWVLGVSRERAAIARHAAAVRRSAARRAAARAAVVAARRDRHAAVGVATWYAWHPGQCASPFLPHGTLLTVTDLATHKTITCLVTDTEAHNPGRVVDLSNWCFEELAPLSQGVVRVRITW